MSLETRWKQEAAVQGGLQKLLLTTNDLCFQ